MGMTPASIPAASRLQRPPPAAVRFTTEGASWPALAISSSMGHRCRCSPWPRPCIRCRRRRQEHLYIYIGSVFTMRRSPASMACLRQLPLPPTTTAGARNVSARRWPPAVGSRCAKRSVKPWPLAGKRVVLFSSMIAVLIINGYQCRATAAVPTGPRLSSTYMHPARCVCPDVTLRDNIAVLHCTAQSPRPLHFSASTLRLLALFAINFQTRLVQSSPLPPNPSAICNTSLAVLAVLHLVSSFDSTSRRRT
jgi:hypothetical protein